MDISSWVGAVGGVLAIVTMSIGALLYINGSYNRARTIALREDNTDLRLRIDDQDKEIELLKTRDASQDARIEHLVSENAMLLDMVTQRAEVGELMALLNDHHHQSMLVLTAIKEGLST